MLTPSNGQGTATVPMDPVREPALATLGRPIVILSDLHLGHPASYIVDPAMVLPLIEGARTVVFNGDTAELLNLRRRADAREKLHRLIELCMGAGIRPILLTGNHDPIASSTHYLDLAEGDVFVTHGDTLHPSLAPWSRDIDALTAERARLLNGAPEPDDLDALMLLTKQTALVACLHEETSEPGLSARLEMVGHFARKPVRVWIAVQYWANVARYAQRLCRQHRPRARYMIIGHTHRFGVWRRPGFTLINTGSFQPLSGVLAARIDDGAITVRQASRRRHAYRLGRTLLHEPLLQIPAGAAR